MTSWQLVDDDRLSSDFVFVEEIPDSVEVIPQALWVGVRRGFGPDSQQAEEPTVWVSYQAAHLGASLEGPVAFSPEAWRRLNEAVEWRLQEHENKGKAP